VLAAAGVRPQANPQSPAAAGPSPYTRDAVSGGFVLVATSFTVAAVVVVGSILLMLAFGKVPRLRLARQQAVAALCAQRGLGPGASPDDFAILGRFPADWLSNSFSSPDHGVVIADMIRPAGKNTQFFSVLSLTVAGLGMPYVAVTRRNIGALVLGGPPALEMESTEFDERFLVRSKDRRSAVMLLDPGMMQLVLDCEQVNFDMVGDKVLAFINRGFEPRHQASDPVEFEQLFRFWEGFVARLPALLRNEYPAAQ
jgi:hypothetical protein